MSENDTIERAQQCGRPITFRAPPDLERAIEVAAARELLSVSAVVRRAVNEWINREASA